jgi:hypothetical protein
MNKNPGLWMVILVAVILWNIYEMASATEAPSQGGHDPVLDPVDLRRSG